MDCQQAVGCHSALNQFSELVSEPMGFPSDILGGTKGELGDHFHIVRQLLPFNFSLSSGFTNSKSLSLLLININPSYTS